MNDIAIRVESVGKQYRIGALQRDHYRTLRDVLTHAATAPFRWFTRNGHSASATEMIWALEDVSFEVKRGEVVGIIGRNGAGKSTLLKILSRITEPSEGHIEILGRVGSLLEVGTGFHPELTGRENIYLNAAILGMKRAEIERKFDEIVAFAEIEKFIDTPVKRYSSGMYVRLAFAVAAHLEPEILIVDEVLAVGDAAFQKKCLGKMGDVAKAGRTVLFVSHNMAAVETLCNRAILLENGRLVFSDNAKATINRYLNHQTQEGRGSRDLCVHPNRITSPDSTIFRRIRLLNSDEEETAVYRLGENILFELLLDLGDQVLNSPYLGIAIDSRGVRICSLLARYMNKDPYKLAKHVLARCNWTGNLLSPGTYSVKLAISHGAEGDRLDVIDDAITFDILGKDIYETGKMDIAGVLFPMGKWEFKNIP